VQQEIALAHHEAMVGKKVEVLVEGAAKVDPVEQDKAARDGDGNVLYPLGRKPRSLREDGTARLTARTRGDHIVSFDGPPPSSAPSSTSPSRGRCAGACRSVAS